MRLARKIELLPRAAADLEAMPERVLEMVLAKLDLLRETPEMGAAMVGAFAGWRSLLAARNTYRIVYRLRKELIEIAWVRHCARRPPKRPLRKG